jgi:pyridoxine 5-phosphate synthase
VKRLGVNIDHVATLRNARGEFHPDPVQAAKFAKKSGANSITIHLREDRRHIQDHDVKKICSIKSLLVNLEISTNLKIVKIALKHNPNFICIVPENRKEITTEGGLNLKKNQKKLKSIIHRFKKKIFEQVYLSIHLLRILKSQKNLKWIALNYIQVI